MRATRRLLFQGVGKDATPFPGLLYFTLDPYLILLSVKQGSIKYHFFWVFGMTWPGIEPRSPRPLANTLSTRPVVKISNINMEKRLANNNGNVLLKKFRPLVYQNILKSIKHLLQYRNIHYSFGNKTKLDNIFKKGRSFLTVQLS